jgi:hypothetical protein
MYGLHLQGGRMSQETSKKQAASKLQMNALCSYETSVGFSQITRGHIPDVVPIMFSIS